MDMIFPGNFEQLMNEHNRKIGKIKVSIEQETEFKKMVHEINAVLTQFGYEKGADVIDRMVNGDYR